MDNSSIQIDQTEQSRIERQKSIRKKQKVLKRNITMKADNFNDPHQELINENYEDDQFEMEETKNDAFSEWQNVNPDILRISYRSIKKSKKKHKDIQQKLSKQKFEESVLQEGVEKYNTVKGISIPQAYVIKQNKSIFDNADTKARIQINIKLPKHLNNKTPSNESDKNNANKRKYYTNSKSPRKYEELTPFEKELTKRDIINDRVIAKFNLRNEDDQQSVVSEDKYFDHSPLKAIGERPLSPTHKPENKHISGSNHAAVPAVVNQLSHNKIQKTPPIGKKRNQRVRSSTDKSLQK